MPVLLDHTVRTPFPLSPNQTACNGQYVAMPFVRTSLGIWNLENLNGKPLELEGHRKRVTCLCFGNSYSPTLLCSAAEDYVIVWNVEKAKADYEAGHQIRGQIIGTTLGYIQHCAFNGDDSLASICVDSSVFIMDTKVEKMHAVLKGHDAVVTCSQFCPHYTSTLVSVSEDRTFKVWNISDGSLVYQSCIISSSAFISLTMCSWEERFAVGTADGQVRVYDLSDSKGFQCLHQVDVTKILKKQQEEKSRQLSEENKGPTVISSRPSWKSQTSNTEADDVPYMEGPESGCAILGLHYTTQRGDDKTRNQFNFPGHAESKVNDVFTSNPMLIIGTTGALIQMNSKTLDVCSYTDIQDPIKSSSDPEGATLSLAGSFCFACSPTVAQTWCVLSSLFQNTAYILHFDNTTTGEIIKNIGSLRIDNEVSSDDNSLTGEITVLSSAPLCANSPLKADLVPKAQQAAKAVKGSKGPVSSAKKSQILDNQPLTFKHHKIKSSGYTEAPRKTMFQPKTNRSASSPSRTAKSEQKKPVKEYPIKSDPPTVLHTTVQMEGKPVLINHVKFSEDGQLLACALANKSVQLFKMPLSSKSTNYTAHNGPVTCVNWSHDSKYFITSSDDKTGIVWTPGHPDPVMTLTNVKHNFQADKEAGSKFSQENPAFPKEVRHARFYYVDKFLLMTSGSSFYMYKYHLDPTKQDVKRYLTNSRYKLVKNFQMTDAQNITAFSAINGFFSYIVLCAGSDKSVEIFDMNVGRSLRVIPDVHTRPAHVICQNEGSSFASHTPNAYDLFLTAAASDCIKLWDLRTNRCVRRYEGHKNRIHPCRVAISPCARFIASGAEDRSAYIFDSASGTYIHKLTEHTDVVGDVEFHPRYPELVTATFDGKIKLYKNR